MTIKRVLLTIFTLISFIFLLTATAMIIEGQHDHLSQSDVGIVLGSKVEIDGTPSNRLKARLDKTIALYQAGYFTYIITSGGIGKEGFDEAKVMRNYLVQHKIPSSAIFVDSNGYNTQATAKNSAILMKQQGFKTVTIVTQYFHIARTKLAMEQNNIPVIYQAHANFFEWHDVYAIAREVVAYYVYILKY